MLYFNFFAAAGKVNWGAVLSVLCTSLGAGQYERAAYKRGAGLKRAATGPAAPLLPVDAGVKAARLNSCFEAKKSWRFILSSALRLVGSIGNSGWFWFQNRGPFLNAGCTFFQRGSGGGGTQSIAKRLSSGLCDRVIRLQISRRLSVFHIARNDTEPAFTSRFYT